MTSTVSAVPPKLNLLRYWTGLLASWLKDCSRFWNPFASTRSLPGPEGKLETIQWPAGFVIALIVIPFAEFVIDTRAPDTTAPDGCDDLMARLSSFES